MQGLKLHNPKSKRQPNQHAKDYNYLSKANGDTGQRLGRHGSHETENPPGAGQKLIPDKLESACHDIKGSQGSGKGKGSPQSERSPPSRAIKCQGASADTVGDLADAGLSCEGRVSVLREDFEHVENSHVLTRSEHTTSCRRARVERNSEEDLQIKSHSSHSDSKRKNNSASGPQCRNRKPGHQHKSDDPDLSLKSEQSLCSVESEEHTEVHSADSETISAVTDSTSGSEAAGAAAGICFFDPCGHGADAADVQVASQPQQDMGPDCDEYNPLRPEYAPFKETSEGRRRIARKLHREISAFISRNDIKAEESRWFRNMIVEKVRHAAQSCWENCSVEVYGSCSTNLFLPHRFVVNLNSSFKINLKYSFFTAMWTWW